MKKTKLSGFSLLLVVSFLVNAGAQRKPDDCSWENKNKARKAVKTRTVADGASYTNYAAGKQISIDEWYAFTCSLDAKVPEVVPADAPIPSVETVKVTLRAYLLGARFERDGDHDMQAELGATPDWNTDHVVIEIPPGEQHCKVRRQLWNLIRQAGCKDDQCILRKPVPVVVRGYVFLGGAQNTKDYCHALSARGMKKDGEASKIRGSWRLQPIFSIEKAPRARI